MDSFDAGVPEELDRELRVNDVRVPGRTQGRTTAHTETGVACRFLAAIAGTDLLQFPARLEPRDRPDLVLSGPACRAGGFRHDPGMDFDIATVAHALLGATIADVLVRVAWLACGSLLTVLGFWGWRKRMVAMERRMDQIGAPAQPMAVHQPVQQTVNVDTTDHRSDTRSSAPEPESVPWATSYASWSREPCNGRGAAILIMRAPSMHDAMTVLDEFCLADDRIDADLAYFAMFYWSSEEAGEDVDVDDRILEIAQRIIEWNHDEDGLAFAANHFRDRSHPDVRDLIEVYEREKMDA